MTDSDEEMFAGMIAEALAPAAPAALNARGIKAGEVAVVAAGSGGKSTVAKSRCPCGSGEFGYNLFNHKREFLMYCCNTCEKPRRAQLKEDGGILTE
jgi:hypothetical protein